MNSLFPGTKVLFILSVLVHFIENGYSQEGWTRHPQFTPTQSFEEVHFFDQNEGYAWGPATRIKTTDGGHSWAYHSALPNCDSPVAFWKSANIGWAACSYGSFHKTVDGGLTWTVVNDQYVGSGMAFRDLFFVNELVGWMSGTDSNSDAQVPIDSGLPRFLLKTVDGGVTWQEQSLPGANHIICDISFLDENIGYACGGNFNAANYNRWGSIYHTSNGGQSWSTVLETDAAFLDIEVVDLNQIWAVGSRTGTGAIFNTTNGGATWVDQSPPSVFQVYESIDMIDGQTGMAVGYNLSSKTNDGGITWQTNLEGGGSFVEMRASGEAWTTSLADLNHTLDFGNTWTIGHSSENNFLNDIQFTSRKNGWAVGENGRIIHTSDSGRTWVAQASNSTATLRGLSFINDSTGWIIGTGGLILQTKNKGTTWTQLQPATSYVSTNASIHFVDSLFGWCSVDRLTLATVDGGKTWVSQATSGSVFFLDRNTGWVGDVTTIRRSHDGGKTWLPPGVHISYPFFPGQYAPRMDIRAIHFADSLHGCAVGDFFFRVTGRSQLYERTIILNTNDGGFSWQTQVPEDVPTYFKDVFMSSKDQGWIVGRYFGILHTTDGGKSWQKQVSPVKSSEQLNAIHFNDSVAWIVGHNIMLRTDDDGGSSTEYFVPNAPSDLNYHFEQDSSISLSWVDNSSNETGFRIQRNDGAVYFFVDYPTVATTAVNQTTFQIRDAPSTNFIYLVSAFNSAGQSRVAMSRPPPPTKLQYDYGKFAVNLTWSDNSQNESGFELERIVGSRITTIPIGANKTSYADSEAVSGNTYHYRVRAIQNYYSEAVSDYSNEIEVAVRYFVDEEIAITHPNPTSGLVRVDLLAPTSEAVIAVYNTVGGLERSITTGPVNDFIDIDLSNLVQGVYILNIQTDSGPFSTMVVRQ